MKDFIRKFKSGWDLATRKPPTRPISKITKITRFFLAGKDSASLWRSIAIKGQEGTSMEQWILNPFTKKKEWCGSYLGEWEIDKKLSEPKEISPADADLKFPGSVRLALTRDVLRGAKR